MKIWRTWAFLLLTAGLLYSDPPPFPPAKPLTYSPDGTVLPTSVNGQPLKLPQGTEVFYLGSYVPINPIGGGGGDVASEQLNSSPNATVNWNGGKKFLRQTVALTQSVPGHLPPANSFVAGTIITYTDPVTADTLTYSVAWTPQGADTLNGGTTPYSFFFGGGTVQLETDGVSAWTSLPRHLSINQIQDTGNPLIKVAFDVSLMPTGVSIIPVTPNSPLGVFDDPGHDFVSIFKTADKFYRVAIGTGLNITGASPNYTLNATASAPASIASFMGTSTVRGMNNDVYIAIRTDGKPGTGTAEDPFDGSTAVKFDAIMDGVAAGTRVILQKNTIFLTNGVKWPDNSKGWTVKDSEYIQGNGATLKLATYPNSWDGVTANQKTAVVGNRYFEAPVNDVVIENITIDCNWGTIGQAGTIQSPWTNKAAMAAFIYGSNWHYIRCTHINSYGDITSGTECFALGGQVPDQTHNPGAVCDTPWIQDCVGLNPHGGYVDGFFIFGVDNTHLATNGRMTGCRTVGDFHPGCYHWAYVKDLEIANNLSNGGGGCYTDTGMTDGVRVIGNNLYCNELGIGMVQVDGVPQRRIWIENNRIRYASNTVYEGIAINATAGQGDDVMISHNKIGPRTDVEIPTGGQAAIDIANGITNVKIIQNEISRSAGFEIYAGTSQPNGYLVAHNIKPSGAPVSLVNNITNIPIDPMTGGGGVDNQFNRNSSLTGALRITGTYPGDIDRVIFYYFPSSYVIQAGDTFQYEVFSEESNARWYPSTWIRFTDVTDTGASVDQNGVANYQGDIPNYGRGRWYFRKTDMTPYVGKTIQRVIVGANSGASEVLTEYWRNVRIVDVNGKTAAMFYEDNGPIPSVHYVTSITNPSAVAVPPPLYSYDGTAGASATTGGATFKNGLYTSGSISAGSTIATDPIWAALGDTVYGTGASTGAKLSGNTTATRKFLRQTGNGSVSAAPAWDTLVAGDIPDLSATYEVVGTTAGLISDTAYNATTWDGDTTHAPSKNAVRDKIESLAFVNSVTTVNGISGTNTAGALTLSLGAITPTSITTDGEASAAAQATGGAGTEGSPYTSSDNTGGIQTAVNNLAALRGGLVNLGASRFNVTAADGVRVTTPAITIAGKATAFNVDPNGVAEGINGPKIKSTTHGIRFGLAANKLGGLGARDLYLYGPSKSTTKDGITVDQNVDQIRFSNLQITNFQYGFDFSASQTDAGYITDSSVLGCGEAIHAPGDVSYLKVANCEFSDNDRIGINISGSNWVRLINCTIVRNAANAGLSNSSNVYLGASNSVISDCVIRNAGASETGGAASVGDGIILHGNNNLVSACQILLNDKGAGIRIQGNNNTIAAGNNFAGNATDIILDSGASGNVIYAASTVSITDNSGNSTNQIIRSGFNASTVPNLQLWLRSDTLALTDGAAVASWADSSGNGNTAAQATGGSQPIFKTAQVNGSPVVRFNGSSQFLATSGNLIQVGTADFAVFLAVKASGDSAANHTVVGDLQSGSPFGGFVLKTNIASAGGPSETATRDTTSGSDTIDAASVTGWQILEAVRVNGVLKLYRTGVSIGTSASTHTISSAAPLAIGKDRTGGSEYFDSDLAEVLVFNSTITPQQRNTVEQYLATKYGLTLPSIGSTPVIVSRERLIAQTGAVTVSSYPVGSSDGSFYVSMNMNVTAAIAVSTSMNCGYTDETNTGRVMILPVTGLAGTYLAGGLVTTTGPFESSVMHIRCKAGTNINLTIASGTFTSTTFNAEGIIQQLQ